MISPGVQSVEKVIIVFLGGRPLSQGVPLLPLCGNSPPCGALIKSRVFRALRSAMRGAAPQPCELFEKSSTKNLSLGSRRVDRQADEASVWRMPRFCVSADSSSPVTTFAAARRDRPPKAADRRSCRHFPGRAA